MIRLRAAGKRDTSQTVGLSPKHDQFAVSGIAPIRLPARKSTLSETIRQRPMRAGCWRFLHANDDKVTTCGFRNDVRSRKVVFRPTVWLFREFSVRIINMNGHFCMIDFCSQPEPIFVPFKQLLPHRFPFTRSELACPVVLTHLKSLFYIGFCRQKSECPSVHCGVVHRSEHRRRYHNDGRQQGDCAATTFSILCLFHLRSVDEIRMS